MTEPLYSGREEEEESVSKQTIRLDVKLNLMCYFHPRTVIVLLNVTSFRLEESVLVYLVEGVSESSCVCVFVGVCVCVCVVSVCVFVC